MRRNIVAILVLALCMICSGCQGNIENSSGELDPNTELDSQTKQKVVEDKEVVFINYKTGIITDNKTDYYNMIELHQYVEDETALYACGVNVYPDDYSELQKDDNESDHSYKIRQKVHQIEQAVELFLDRGLMVVQEYPYCLYNNETLYGLKEDYPAYAKKYVEADLIVVGTYEQLMNIFDGAKEEEPWREFKVVMAPRPNLLEVMDEYIPEVDYTTSDGEEAWVISYAKDLPDALGSEYCTMTVSVITMK